MTDKKTQPATTAEVINAQDAVAEAMLAVRLAKLNLKTAKENLNSSLVKLEEIL